MSDQQQIVEAITAFYREILRHPYLPDTALKIPPASGWDTIDVDTLRDLGKNDTVIDMIRHFPYLEADHEYRRLLVEYETVPIAYTKTIRTMIEEIQPLPGHCVYLTEGVDREGYSLILDTARGTVTAFSLSGYEITVSHEEYERTAPNEQWTAHRTLPATELFELWSSRYARLVNMLVPNPIGEPTTGKLYMRIRNRSKADQLARETGPFEEWRVHLDERTDSLVRRDENAYIRHVAATYNCFLRHGWPDHFDKEACRAKVIELERQAGATEKRLLDEVNPDAALFDD